MQRQENLKKLREEIDSIDARLIRLLGKRFAAAGKIRKVKRHLGIGILQLRREQEVLGKVRAAAKKAGVNQKFAERLFRTIIAESKNVQKR